MLSKTLIEQSSFRVNPLNRLLSVAPMMDCTDKHCRYFLRLFSKNILLYTEMITADAIMHGDKDKLLSFNSEEHPLAIQLGGSNPLSLKLSAIIAEQYGYQEVNINVGCPSSRVQSGAFGACLMKQPKQVADCVDAIANKVSVPVTVKTRIGVDDHDSYDFLYRFINSISQADCDVFIIHARKAWLKGLSPKQNREIPPLRYDVVYQIKKDFPHLSIIMNGGIKTKEDVKQHLQFVDGVMIGREAYNNPYFLAELDKELFDNTTLPDRHDILSQFSDYMHHQVKNGVKLHALKRHLFGLFHGLPGAREWRRSLSKQNV